MAQTGTDRMAQTFRGGWGPIGRTLNQSEPILARFLLTRLVTFFEMT
jgi:hypothetical protein